ncbi:MAG TPA: Crp/Fnr family transcriptional regulator [Sphingobacteriaceae bacterium]|nr:Crp/Fnr family transcriptional regulator [Sphingobacteriaceae bacterium]
MGKPRWDVPFCLPSGAISRRALRAALAASRVRAFRQGEMILPCCGSTPALHLIRAGLVKVSLYSKNGHEKIIGLRGPGSLVGTLWAPTGHVPCKGVTALSPGVTTRSWDHRALAGLARSHPELLGLLVKFLSYKVAVLTTQIEGLAFASANQRICSCLLELATAFGRQDHGGSAVTIPIAVTQNDLASMAAVSRVTASKAWGHLREQGVVSKAGRGLVVTDLEALRSLVSG